MKRDKLEELSLVELEERIEFGCCGGGGDGGGGDDTYDPCNIDPAECPIDDPF
ncbi:hypothetical protein [Aliikangiella marina]|uniref:hypothetical protein n=1 Tax=Aliikangiella marina TaxID=1712262 RepID=UPI00163DBA6A|nr:hypothetical protein [Aliikangiella marina]